ncbi:protocatechuate 3,4-dioxygenase subunit beta [Phenylobacterium sp. J426]|uniref:protocatechuate 3,4-dioxygenase subunit beta n=1 Tax=Phenylobacterium sp. J426 TaxID=2898439 RepID=UPI002150708A|nr:protocatechuate 3,4-dioxygenase subunit beta [Phenylobacterium sp. J426]MCR5872741.1 protocatechuate 3,4-dioxygenase subunit beta [Phenylobacterium sp. J426]
MSPPELCFSLHTATPRDMLRIQMISASRYVAEDEEAQPPLLFPPYRSTVLRAPKRPPVRIPQTLTEITGPASAWESLGGPACSDLTKQHAGAPLGQRIVMAGRVLDEAGRPVPRTLIEVWQANAAGRYAHAKDQWDAPLDPNFTGAGRLVTDDEGRYRLTTIRPGAYPWGNHDNAWRPAHIHLSLFGAAFASRLVTQCYFEGDPLIALDPIAASVPEGARERLIARFDLGLTEPSFALGYVFDIVLRGPASTPTEDPA